jgi:catechol 2,3-dioxygenase-like lactoylglutathione lyase family enzyme
MVEVGPDRRVTAIRFRRWDGSEGEASGKVFVLAAHGIEIPRLLLKSRSEATPKGVANASDQVGRNLMDHPAQLSWALAPTPLWPYRGPLSTSGIENLRDGSFRKDRPAFRIELGNDGWAWPKGAPTTTAADLARFGLRHAALNSALRSQASRHLASLLEQLPEPETACRCRALRTDWATTLRRDSPRLALPTPRFLPRSAPLKSNTGTPQRARVTSWARPAWVLTRKTRSSIAIPQPRSPQPVHPRLGGVSNVCDGQSHADHCGAEPSCRPGQSDTDAVSERLADERVRAVQSEEKAMVEVVGVDHLVLSVGDFETSKKFYAPLMEFLGFGVEAEYESMMGWANGKTLFWIAAGDEEGKKHKYRKGDIGFHHYAFRLRNRKDVDALQAYLEENGATIVDPAGEYYDDYYAVFFLDPDGMKLEGMRWGERHEKAARKRAAKKRAAAKKPASSAKKTARRRARRR